VSRPLPRAATGTGLLLLLASSAAAEGQDGIFRFSGRPSLRLGKVLEVDFRVKTHNDFRGFSPHIDTGPGLHDPIRFRLGVEGRLFGDLEYAVEYELMDRVTPWRDLHLSYQRFGRFRSRVGKFRLPFSLEQLQSGMSLDFIYRSRLGALLAPARDTGIEFSGTFFGEGLDYQLGLFRHDGMNAAVRFRPIDPATGQPAAEQIEQRTGGRTFAARLTGKPLRLAAILKPLQAFELGGGFTDSPLSEGLTSLRGRTIAGTTFFSSVYVSGSRRRLGAELRWAPGRFSLQGEWARVYEQRKRQSIQGADLPDLVSRAWYLGGTWLLTGGSNATRHRPAKAFLSGGGTGNLELALRYEQLRVGSDAHAGPPSRDPRAANLLGNRDRIWTAGMNWYLNHWTKIQFNGIREKLQDVERSPVPGRVVLWTWIARLQVVL